MAINGRSLNQVKLDVTDPSTSELRFRDGVDDVLEQVDRSPTSVSLSGVITGVPAALDVNNELAITTLFDTDNGETDAMGDTIPAEESGNVLSIQGVGGDVTYRWIEGGGGGGAEVREFRSTALRNAATTDDTLWTIGDIASIRPEEIATARTLSGPLSSVSYTVATGVGTFTADSTTDYNAIVAQLLTLGFISTAGDTTTVAEMDINVNDVGTPANSFRVTFPVGTTITYMDGGPDTITFTNAMAVDNTTNLITTSSGYPNLAAPTNYIYNAATQTAAAATVDGDWVEIQDPPASSGGGGVNYFVPAEEIVSFSTTAGSRFQAQVSTSFDIISTGTDARIGPGSGGSSALAFVNAITGATGNDVTAFDPGMGATSGPFTTTVAFQANVGAGTGGAGVVVAVPAGTNFTVTREATAPGHATVAFDIDLTSTAGIVNNTPVSFVVDANLQNNDGNDIAILVAAAEQTLPVARIQLRHGLDGTYTAADDELILDSEAQVLTVTGTPDNLDYSDPIYVGDYINATANLNFRFDDPDGSMFGGDAFPAGSGITTSVDFDSWTVITDFGIQALEFTFADQATRDNFNTLMTSLPGFQGSQFSPAIEFDLDSTTRVGPQVGAGNMFTSRSGDSEVQTPVPDAAPWRTIIRVEDTTEAEVNGDDRVVVQGESILYDAGVPSRQAQGTNTNGYMSGFNYPVGGIRNSDIQQIGTAPVAASPGAQGQFQWVDNEHLYFRSASEWRRINTVPVARESTPRVINAATTADRNMAQGFPIYTGDIALVGPTDVFIYVGTNQTGNGGTTVDGNWRQIV